MLKTIQKEYTHFVNYETEVDINNKEEFNFHVVYFINCLMNPNFFTWLENQINLVKNFNAPIYIVATITPSEEENFKVATRNLFPDNNITIECYYENEFEYRGILKAWELGQIHNTRNDIILYFHSKAITRFSTYESMEELLVYNIILKDIQKIKEIFSIFPKINKVGFCNSNAGWMWYNFWYARGSYINNNEKPFKMNNNRWYYEDWLYRQLYYDNQDENSSNKYKLNAYNCYSFYTDKQIIGNIGSYYIPKYGTYHNTIYDNKKVNDELDNNFSYNSK